MSSATTASPIQREPKLLGQTVVVIGGSAGIGLETARAARAEGANLILTGRNSEHLGHAARELSALRTAAFDATDFERLEQLREAFPFDQLPRYLLRDRDAIFGDEFREQAQGLGICEVLSAPRSPWQRAYVERVIGSVRRECLDHVIVFHESSLRRILTSYFDYYHRSRTHLSLGKDSPEP